ncbi:lysophospholipid acyltransferase family protein [bacterium]|nr:lysophospholipid acyltransferase family protein [bacterium]
MRRNKTLRKMTDWLAEIAGGPVISCLVRLLGWTLRLKVLKAEHYRFAVESGRPIIAVFWHQDFPAIAIFKRRIKYHEVAVMVSRSRDGDKLASVIERLGMVAVRASSSRGAVAGLIELVKYLKGNAGATAAIAPDGPRGPRHEAKPGVALLARKADALIVPFGFAYSSQFVFKSWDRTRLPKPFAKMAAYIGPPIDPRQWAGDDHERALQLGKLLDKLNRKAEEMMKEELNEQ